MHSYITKMIKTSDVQLIAHLFCNQCSEKATKRIKQEGFHPLRLTNANIYSRERKKEKEKKSLSHTDFFLVIIF